MLNKSDLLINTKNKQYFNSCQSIEKYSSFEKKNKGFVEQTNNEIIFTKLTVHTKSCVFDIFL